MKHGTYLERAGGRPRCSGRGPGVPSWTRYLERFSDVVDVTPLVPCRIFLCGTSSRARCVVDMSTTQRALSCNAFSGTAPDNTRWRLNPAGDRQANHALWRIVLTRMSLRAGPTPP